jgi:hypothetical protein
MVDSGKINIIVSEETRGDVITKGFRVLHYSHCYEENTNCQIALEIYQRIKDCIYHINPDIVVGDIVGLLYNLQYIRILFSNITQSLNIFHDYIPRILIRYYERIQPIQDSIHENIDYYSNLLENGDMIEIYNDLIQSLYELNELLNTVKTSINNFWQQRPEIYIRLPAETIKNILSVDIFLTPSYLPYTLGLVPLPEWLDSIIINKMNDARKIYQTREQTIERHKELVMTLSLFRCLPPDVIKLIVLFTPVDVIFDLMPFVSLFDLPPNIKKLECNNGNVISVYFD